MGGGGPETIQANEAARGPAFGAESIGAGQSILGAIAATGYLRGGASDPRVQLATIDTQKDELSKQLALATQRYEENMSALGRNPAARANADAHFMEMSGIRQRISDLDASKSSLMDAAGLTQQGVDVAKLFGKRLQTGLETGSFVDPAEEAAMRTAMSGISQDVATTRGLNRSDVPVMQSIAPTLASMWLGQQNTNKAFYTGALQANQGLGAQTNQGLMGVSNPGLGLSSVYSGLRGSNTSGGGKQGYGSLDYLGASGTAAGGIGLGLYGASAAGLLGGAGALGLGTAGGAAAGGTMGAYGAGMAMGCWIAEALYGVDTLETWTIRWWLNTHFNQSRFGALVMRLYRRYGQQVAARVRRSALLQHLLRPVFDRALTRGKQALGVMHG